MKKEKFFYNTLNEVCSYISEILVEKYLTKIWYNGVFLLN